MNIILWSFHIRDLGLDAISSLNVLEGQLREHLLSIMKTIGAREGWYLSTCNRVEYLFVLESEAADLKPPFTKHAAVTYKKIDDIVGHLLEVSCAFDSLVFGENQILGQIKQSYNFVLTNKICGPKISKLFNRILKESKEIRTETGLNNLNTSVGGVGAKILIQKINSKSSILLVGASETHGLMAQTLMKKGFKNIAVTNRTDSKAKSFSKNLKIKFLSWNDFEKSNFGKFTALSFATDANVILLKKEHLEKAKPTVVIDLSLPANTNGKLVKKYKADYINLENIQSRLVIEKEQLKLMKKLVQHKIDYARSSILFEIASLDLSHIIVQSIERSKEIKNTLIEKELPREFQNMTPEQKQALEKWTQALVNKLNHVHIETLKNYVFKAPGRNTQK